jgi:hypothetical protein
MGNLCPRRHRWPEEYDEQDTDESFEYTDDDEFLERRGSDGTDYVEGMDEGKVEDVAELEAVCECSPTLGPAPSRPRHWMEYSPANPRRRLPTKSSGEWEVPSHEE